MKTHFWLTEPQTTGYRVQWRITNILHQETSPFQELSIVETVDFGRALLLDGAVQVTEKDHFIYNEMITHIPLSTHPVPQKVLIIGGGDGGAAAEVLKYDCVQRLDLVEIDERVVRVCEEFLPDIAGKVRDQRVNLIFENGLDFIKDKRQEYDIIIVDSSDPVGPAVQLFEKPFYENAKRALKEDGLLVCQSESPFFYQDILRKVTRTLRRLFPITGTYLAVVPTYPSGLWSFTMASNRHDPSEVDPDSLPQRQTQYYSPAIFHSVFSLPQFVKEIVEED